MTINAPATKATEAESVGHAKIRRGETAASA